MVFFSMTYPPWHSITDNNYKILIAELSNFNKKLSSLETLLIFQYMEALSKGDKIKAIIFPKMTDLIKFFEKNRK